MSRSTQVRSQKMYKFMWLRFFIIPIKQHSPKESQYLGFYQVFLEHFGILFLDKRVQCLILKIAQINICWLQRIRMRLYLICISSLSCAWYTKSWVLCCFSRHFYQQFTMQIKWLSKCNKQASKNVLWSFWTRFACIASD